jgi:hypothetical protein
MQRDKTPVTAGEFAAGLGKIGRVFNATLRDGAEGALLEIARRHRVTGWEWGVVVDSVVETWERPGQFPPPKFWLGILGEVAGRPEQPVGIDDRDFEGED